MNEMHDARSVTHNTVEGYPAAKLPDELRGKIDSTATVTVSVAVKPVPGATFADIFAALHEDRVMSDDPAMRIRALREEWDDRERFLASIPRGGTK